MKISVKQVSKKFLNHVIFKNVSLAFEAPGNYALLGANGSGKSTLLRIIGGMQMPTKGAVEFQKEGQIISENKIFEHISFCAPGMELLEEMTLEELLQFHFNFKKLINSLDIPQLLEILGLSSFRNTQIANFSSGMKQRVKLAQAIFSQSPILLLDEPCSNLDLAGVQQYQDWMRKFSHNKLVIVASNDEREYNFCQHHISLASYK